MKTNWNWEKLWENLPAVVLSIAAALILFFFHRLGLVKDEILTMPITTVIHSNLVQGESADLNVRLTIRKKSDQTQTVNEDDLVVIADFLSHSREGTYRSALKVAKKPGAAIDLKGVEITLDPQDITLKLEKKVTRQVPITLSVADAVPQGYELRNWTLTPGAVTVVGPRSRVEGLKSIATEHVDLLDLTGPFRKEVVLLLEDPLLRILEKDKPILSGEILETRNTKIWPAVPVTALNLSPGLSLSAKLPEVTIRVQGPLSLLDGLSDQDVSAGVDLLGLVQPGDYRVQVVPKTTEGIDVLELSPRFLDITLKKKEGP